MSPYLRLGLIQFDIAWEQPGENIRRIEQLLDHAPELDVLILPEMWSTGFTMRPATAAESTDGVAVQWMKSFARLSGSVVCGSIALREGDRFVNRFYAIWPDGSSRHYDKKHLFSYGKEDLHYIAGQSRITFEVKGWSIMPVICYDLRFPAWCRNTMDYDLLVVVANWPSARIHHWDALLKARAIENQAFVAAVNRLGVDGNQLMYPGHTSMYDMNGETILPPSDQAGLLVGQLDRNELERFRSQFRFLQDRDPIHF